MGSLFDILKYVCDNVVKRFTFAISSPDELFLVLFSFSLIFLFLCRALDNAGHSVSFLAHVSSLCHIVSFTRCVVSLWLLRFMFVFVHVKQLCHIYLCLHCFTDNIISVMVCMCREFYGA